MNVVFSHHLAVRFRDCDALGHVNNAVYLTYLEEARLHHWRSSGVATDGERVPQVILARAEIDYRRPAIYGELLVVRLGVAAIGRTSFTYEYEIVDRHGHLVASARTVLVRYDHEARTPVPISDALKDALMRPIHS